MFDPKEPEMHILCANCGQRYGRHWFATSWSTTKKGDPLSCPSADNPREKPLAYGIFGTWKDPAPPADKQEVKQPIAASNPTPPTPPQKQEPAFDFDAYNGIRRY
jgi:hypothetical protein